LRWTYNATKDQEIMLDPPPHPRLTASGVHRKAGGATPGITGNGFPLSTSDPAKLKDRFSVPLKRHIDSTRRSIYALHMHCKCYFCRVELFSGKGGIGMPASVASLIASNIAPCLIKTVGFMPICLHKVASQASVAGEKYTILPPGLFVLDTFCIAISYTHCIYKGNAVHCAPIDFACNSLYKTAHYVRKR
jgi:hypothetical protein